MENASKALIIAGAILLSILIISLGIFIFSQASEVTKSSNLSEIEILRFNEKYTSLEGSNVRGNEVNTLLTRIVQNNVTNQEDESKQVSVEIKAKNWQSSDSGTPNGKITSITSKALTGKTYKVSCTLDNKTGLVSKITIEDA